MKGKNHGSPPRPQILFVDDSLMVLQLLEGIFSQDYIVATAKDGQNGLRKAKESYFDAIISDIDLPGMDGIEFFQTLSQYDPNINRRFLFLSGLVTEDRKTFLDTNRVPFFWKPVNILLLKQKIIEILEGNRQQK